MRQKEFLERLIRIKFEKKNHSEFEKFLEMIALDNKKGYVDLTKLQYLFEHYKSKSPEQMFKQKEELKMDDDTQIYFYNLCEEFNNNINGIIEYFDFDNTGDISKLEFVIKSSKLFGRGESKRYEEIYKSLLLPGETVITNQRMKE